jgi:nucleotide-binding universal stress UspA family protein
MSPSAARAAGDALPLLKRAKSVQILVGRGEKAIPSRHPAASLLDYLAAHEIKAAVDEFDVSGRKIGDALLERASHHKADLMVMGAFGHSRLREFVLGGATRRLLDTSKIPLFMSH